MHIINQSPVNFATNVVKNVFITLEFDTELLYSSINNNTVIVANVDTQEPIECIVDYIPSTKKITIQFFELLESNTEYTIIVVGGTEGLLLKNGTVFSSSNYSSIFKTGTTVDPNLPLASTTEYNGVQPVNGIDGIYSAVLSKSGDPIAHIVTTAGQIGPSGVIVPAPNAIERYIAASGVYPEEGDNFKLLSSTPEDSDIDVIENSIELEFNSTITEYENITIKVEDILGFEKTNENIQDNYNIAVNDCTITITPKAELSGEFTKSCIYTVSLSNVKNITNENIDSVSISFRTKIVPFYTTIGLVRNIGAVSSNKSDLDIAKIIYENSLWIYENSKVTFDAIDNPPQAAKNFVLCKSRLDIILLKNIEGGNVVKKTLADLTIEYGAAVSTLLNKLIDDLNKCIEKNKNLLGLSGSVSPVSAVKAAEDTRAPITDSSWRRLRTKDFE